MSLLRIRVAIETHGLPMLAGYRIRNDDVNVGV